MRTVVYQIAGPRDHKDLTQEAFVRIWQGLESFRGASQLKSWIYRVATNVALDYLRRNARRPEESEVDLSRLPSREAGGEASVTNRQLVEAGLRFLDPKHRAVVVLALLHELSLSEIGTILGLPEGTVKSRLHHGKEQLRKFLADTGERNE